MLKLTLNYILVAIVFFSSVPSDATEPHPGKPTWDCSWILKRMPLSEGERQLLESFRLSENAGFAKISSSWKRVREIAFKYGNHIDAKIDAQRLINQSDWEDALRDFPDSPYYKYGWDAINNFYAVTFLVRQDAGGTDPDYGLLIFFRTWAMQQLPFHGFEGRRLVKRFRDGEINQDELKALLKRAYEGNEEIAGVPHRRLMHAFREDPIDEIEHRGSSLDENKNRYFSEVELRAHRSNPYLRVDEASIKPRQGGGYTGIVRYFPPKDIANTVDKVFAEQMEKVERAFRRGGPCPEMIGAMTDLEKHLISIHPFLDGNGRTIRAAMDVIYHRHGLPAPMRPNENDLVVSQAEAIEFTRVEMIRSVNAWIDSAKAGVK